MKAKISEVNKEPKFDPIKLEIDIQTEEELNELIVRLSADSTTLSWGDLPKHSGDRTSPILSLLYDYKTSRDKLKEVSKMSRELLVYTFDFSPDGTKSVYYENSDIERIDNLIANIEAEYQYSQIELANKIVKVLFENHDCLSLFNKIFDRFSAKDVSVNIYPEMATIYIRNAMYEYETQIRIDDIPLEKMIEILTE